MPSNSITVKPSNHLIYHAPADKKIALLQKILKENSSKDILVVCANDAKELEEALNMKQIKVVEDKELVQDKSLKCEFLISYDMPIKAIVYMARVSRASHKAVMLLDKSEQKAVHAIETLLGRAIKQQVIDGFAYEEEAPKEIKPSYSKKLTKEQISEIAKKRHADATVEKVVKPKREGDSTKGKWDKKKKEPNKYLGKDENGKAIFSGKSGERNHRYDGTPRDKYDAPKKVGKKISIKARKPKKSED